VPASIYLPEWVDPVKLAAIRASGADAVLAGATFDEAEEAAIAEASRSGRVYVSAYDDPWVIAGQGTVALEILEQCLERGDEPPAAVLVPLSGGGLAGGIAAALHARLGDAEPATVAVSARNAAVMLASLEAGRPVERPEHETLAGALAGGIGLDNRHSFALVRDHVAEHVVVDESDIASAMRHAVTRLRLVVEGGGAVALAALSSGAWAPPSGRSGPIVVVLSGGNVAPDTLARVLRG
jgi:threonine dehydratase